MRSSVGPELDYATIEFNRSCILGNRHDSVEALDQRYGLVSNFYRGLACFETRPSENVLLSVKPLNAEPLLMCVRSGPPLTQPEWISESTQQLFDRYQQRLVSLRWINVLD